jgi:hypothetical protein
MKLDKLPYVAFTLALLATSACFRNDIRTVQFDVPQLKSDACTRFILEAINSNKIEGVKSIVPDIAGRKLAVTYDSTRLGIKNIEFLIASAGFDANTTVAPPEIKAKLPPECQ